MSIRGQRRSMQSGAGRGAPAALERSRAARPMS